MTIGSGASVSFATAQFDTTQIVVNGLLKATDDQFINSGNASLSQTQIYVNPHGELTATNSTFGIDKVYLAEQSTVSSTDLTDNVFNSAIYAPALTLPSLSPNQSFQEVDILPATLSSGQSVSLSPLGTVTTANQFYVFPGLFTVGPGATLSMSSGASVLIRDSQQLLVDGTLNITGARSVAIEDQDDGGASGGITVNGTIAISNTSLTRLGGTNGDDTTLLQINPGAKVTMSATTFAWDQLLLDSGAATISVSGNDFSGVGADGVIASGDPSSHIPLDHNYWGTGVTEQIDAKIVDHKDHTNLPTVDYEPFVNATITTASPSQKSFSLTDQTVTLSASVNTTLGDPVNDGTLTFTILNGSQVVGQPTSPVPVSNGLAMADFTLPGNTPIGQYIIKATYNGTNLYLPSIDASQTLTVSAAAAKLVIHTPPSSTATAGQPFAAQPVIYVEDQDGNLLTSDNTTVVTVSLASGTGSLQGTKSVTVVNGVATFVGLSDEKAETITLEFSGDGLTAGPSSGITISPAAPYQLRIQTQPSPMATAGQPFAAQPVIYEVDQYGNIETGDNSTTITATLASGNGPLLGTTMVTLAEGVATFVGLADNKAGVISLSFAGGGFTAGPSNNVFISPGQAAQLVIVIPPLRVGDGREPAHRSNRD